MQRTPLIWPLCSANWLSLLSFIAPIFLLPTQIERNQTTDPSPTHQETQSTQFLPLTNLFQSKKPNQKLKPSKYQIKTAATRTNKNRGE
uniref:Uncharacterized protein n=1 Tax=Arundo donax TaxID=35708 RepID=A0A0A9C1Q2_ARUDO